MPVRPQSLVMDLLSAVGGQPIPVRALVRAAEVFGLTGNSTRVALARLLAAEKVERSERGAYGIAPAARVIQSHVTSWSELESRGTSWSGGWIGVHVGALDRDRSTARRRARALSFVGLRELESGLFVRPDNVRGGVAKVRELLARFGLEPEAPVFSMAELDAATRDRATALFDGPALVRGYQRMRKQLDASNARLDSLPLERAVRECFTLGGQAIRLLAFDPVLPAPIVDESERRALVEAMRRYDRAGRRVWRKFMQREGAPALESLLEHRTLGRAA
jgi:phenylacetic acid degradation operon negative regulatory protein